MPTAQPDKYRQSSFLDVTQMVTFLSTDISNFTTSFAKSQKHVDINQSSQPPDNSSTCIPPPTSKIKIHHVLVIAVLAFLFSTVTCIQQWCFRFSKNRKTRRLRITDSGNQTDSGANISGLETTASGTLILQPIDISSSFPMVNAPHGDSNVVKSGGYGDRPDNFQSRQQDSTLPLGDPECPKISIPCNMDDFSVYADIDEASCSKKRELTSSLYETKSGSRGERPIPQAGVINDVPGDIVQVCREVDNDFYATVSDNVKSRYQPRVDSQEICYPSTGVKNEALVGLGGEKGNEFCTKNVEEKDLSALYAVPHKVRNSKGT